MASLSGCVSVPVESEIDRGTPLIVTRTGNLAHLNWQSRVGELYTVLYADGQHAGANWRPLRQATDIPGNGQEIVLEDYVPTGQTRYYRLIVRPR